MAAAMTADSSRRYLAKMTGSLREGKIFIDHFRNSREATSVAAYSTRPRACAPIFNEAISSFLTKSQSHHAAGTQGTNGCETSVFLDGPKGRNRGPIALFPQPNDDINLALWIRLRRSKVGI